MRQNRGIRTIEIVPDLNLDERRQRFNTTFKTHWQVLMLLGALTPSRCCSDVAQIGQCSIGWASMTVVRCDAEGPGGLNDLREGRPHPGILLQEVQRQPLDLRQMPPDDEGC